ncbi:hypothetical protein KOR42_46400 [Thalassoglobus neptunius]|uniref:Secreted protein containing DUF1552 n=1 Tax=Thalassoglobus neptunius TaxID=1938619 RepID=A0A5C5VXS0_9PLAN|nr:DUF1552 domain-containing protein [Thalassoglobus neptunius]TWT42785.1 hypothetical protein KOR42_46400 [Thalassoglobus neptunius]
MNLNRRMVLKSMGGTLALPLLESLSFAAPRPTTAPTRFLVVGNPFGMHPEHFFPTDFGKDFTISPTLRSLEWLKDRMTIISHTDHNMVSGHGREISFLSGVLPTDAQAFPEKNMSLDQLFARHIGSQVRYPSVGAALDSGIRMSWTANGVEKLPITDPQELFNHLFLNLSPQEKEQRREMLQRNASILDTLGSQFEGVKRNASRLDRDRLDQFQTSIRELENSLADRETWLDRDKPSFDIADHFVGETTIANKYDAMFDMIAYAFETDLTRVASIEFPAELNYTDIDGVNRSYHGCTHNGRGEDLVKELVSIESFQIARLTRCLNKLDSIREPNSEGTMLDHTIVLFGSGMGYGGTHSNRNLPVFVAGGGFKHRGYIDGRDNSGNNMPLCNLYVTLMQRFGIERDSFNTSTGALDLSFS